MRLTRVPYTTFLQREKPGSEPRQRAISETQNAGVGGEYVITMARFFFFSAGSGEGNSGLTFFGRGCRL